MIPHEINTLKAYDAHGEVHSVQVMQLYQLVAGTGVSDEPGRWSKCDRLQYVVDDEVEIEQDFSRAGANRTSGDRAMAPFAE